MLSKFTWFYSQAPAGSGTLWGLVVSERDNADRPNIVGGMGFGLREWQFGQRMVKAGLLADLAVAPDHRSLGPALALTRTVVADMRKHVAIGYGFPNASAVGIFRRNGWSDLATLVRYARMIRSESYIARSLPFRALANLVAIPIDTVMGGLVSLSTRQARRRWKLIGVSEIDGRFDDLWERARRDYSVIGQRDAAFLTWRFSQHPWHKFEVLAMQPNGVADRLDGYAVLQCVGDVIHVRDIFTQRASIGSLVDLLIMEAKKRRMGALSIVCPEGGLVGTALSCRGFSVRGPCRSAVLDPDSTLPECQPGVPEIVSCYMTEADEDT